jgi:hypothetical protein
MDVSWKARRGTGLEPEAATLGRWRSVLCIQARPMTDAYAQLELFKASVSAVIVRQESRDVEWFCRKRHQSGNEYWSPSWPRHQAGHP